MLDWSSTWSLTQGRGVTVAVVDSGVDYTPQLAGRVDAIDLTGQGVQDCVGDGTAVASIIAARDAHVRGIPFYGVAPAARILSVKVNIGDTGSSGLLAQGIRDAAIAGAQVINLSVQTAVNSPALRSAVAFAQGRDAVVVAAAGNDNPGGGVGPYYPASYPGVISVGAVNQTGALTTYSDRKTRVSVTAPGANIASAWPGGYNQANQGTGFAAAFVSGVAALVRARYPKMSAEDIAARIEDTAAGGTGLGTGNGEVNPLQAVTAVSLPAATPPTAQAATISVPVERAIVPPQPTDGRSLALTLSASVFACLTSAGVILTLLRRRRHQ